MGAKTIHIVGAGPAGLTAGINLNRQGYEVIIHEAEAQIGGDPSWHPSCHATPIDMKAVQDFIGIDVSGAFKESTHNMRYFHNNEERPFEEWTHSDIPYMYNVIRGPHPLSLDTFLYNIAVEEGVKVQFNDKWTTPDFEAAEKPTIITTGFGQSAYEDMGYRFTPFYGYWFRGTAPQDQCHLNIYTGDFTNEYGYSTSKDGLWYSLCFAKGDVSPEGLATYAEYLEEREGIHVDQWLRFTGTTPRFPKLFDGNFIFGGTSAGFIEPAAGFGIVASMLGGKIAAQAVEDPEGATENYNRFVKPIADHVKLKFQDDYVVSIHFRDGNPWFDIPTKKAGFADWQVEE